MSAHNPYLQRSLRFCELCGQFIGSMTRKDWDRSVHLCQECVESRDSFILMAGDKSHIEWDVLWQKR
jgi:hypothetical protein